MVIVNQQVVHGYSIHAAHASSVLVQVKIAQAIKQVETVFALNLFLAENGQLIVVVLHQHQHLPQHQHQHQHQPQL